MNNIKKYEIPPTRLSYYITNENLEKVDAFKKANGYTTRNAAINALINKGLKGGKKNVCKQK